MTVLLWVAAGLTTWTAISLALGVVVGRALRGRPDGGGRPGTGASGFVLAA